MSVAGFDLECIDHFVMTTRDVEETARFYDRVVGLRIERRDGRVAMHLGTQKINLHLAGWEFAPYALRPTIGGADFCLITRTAIGAVVAHLTTCGVDVVEGPVTKQGARGPMTSVYFRDPDGNLVEIAHYPAGG